MHERPIQGELLTCDKTSLETSALVTPRGIIDEEVDLVAPAQVARTRARLAAAELGNRRYVPWKMNHDQTPKARTLRK